ncbi:MAG: hypothetical protein WC730_02380 [Patescibacteria group bacterium]
MTDENFLDDFDWSDPTPDEMLAILSQVIGHFGPCIEDIPHPTGAEQFRPLAVEMLQAIAGWQNIDPAMTAERYHDELTAIMDFLQRVPCTAGERPRILRAQAFCDLLDLFLAIAGHREKWEAYIAYEFFLKAMEVAEQLTTSMQANLNNSIESSLTLATQAK